MKSYSYKLLIPCVALLCSNARGQNSKYDIWEENYAVQALLGGVKYEDLKFNNEDGTDAIEIDMSTIPQLGGAWMTLPKGERFQYGLECSFLLGFKFDSVNYAYLGGNGAYVSLSTSMWMFDFAGGPYAHLLLTDNLRVYGGAGPLMVFADYRSDREYDDPDDPDTPDVSNNESAFGLGVYARTGLELRIHQKGMLGLGVRGNWSNVDFSDVGGNSDISGIAGFVTYTAGL